MEKTLFKNILLAILFAVVTFTAVQRFDIVLQIMGFVLSLFTPLLIGLCMAFLINVLMIPIEKQISKSNSRFVFRLKRPVALLTSLILIVLFIFLLFFMIVPELQSTLAEMIEELPSFWNKSKDSLMLFLENQPLIADEITNLTIDWKAITDQASEFFRLGGASVLQSTFDFTTKIFSTFINLLIGFIFALYLLAQKECLTRQLKKLLYAFINEAIVDRLIVIGRLSHRTFSNFVTGQLTDALVLGALCYVGMLIFRFPYPLVISSLVGVTALIPVVGALIGITIGAFLIVMLSPIQAVWFLVFIIILHQLEGNLIYPKIIGESIGLPGIWVLAAVTIGGSAFGVLGMLIGVPLSSVVYALLKETVEHRLKLNKITKRKYS